MHAPNPTSICAKMGAEPLPPLPGSNLGLALSTLGRQPVHGVRHAPTATTNGWYLWCGSEWSDDEKFYAPVHWEHLVEMLPHVVAYLDLPPGYRILLDDQGYEDVWFDAEVPLDDN